VRLYKTGYDNTLITDRGFLTQTDWSGASGQVDFSDATRYFSSDAGIDTHSPAGDVKLALSAGKYATSGHAHLLVLRHRLGQQLLPVPVVAYQPAGPNRDKQRAHADRHQQ